jgi:dihydrofolate reductase
MRKLSLQQFAVSVDGYICQENTDFYQLWQSLVDEEFDAYFTAALKRAGTHVMGRITYEAMSQFWPAHAKSPNPGLAAVAAIMNDIPKVVFSRSLAKADWSESRIARGDTAEEIARLKTETGGEIVAHGGASFVRSLVQLEVVDEYRLYVAPFAIGNGVSLFGELKRPQALRLQSVKSFPSGIMEVVYEHSRD